MTCFVRAGAIFCGRGSPRPKKPEPPRCRHPGCDRAASQAGWGCRAHFFKLTPDLRARIHAAATAELAANGRLGQAWTAVAEEAERWLANQRAHPAMRSTWRQPELPW